MLVPIGNHRAEDSVRHNPVMQSGRGPGKGIGRDNHEDGGGQQRQEQADRPEGNAGRAKSYPEPAPWRKSFHNRMTFDMMTLPLGLLAHDFTKSLQSFSPGARRYKFS